VRYWAAIVLVSGLLATAGADAQVCSGCGCKGGPGYRGPNGQCVAWKTIGRVCGTPPTTHCTAEGPNAGAEDEAERAVKAIEERRARPAKALRQPSH
jgi:hypothetical protein